MKSIILILLLAIALVGCGKNVRIHWDNVAKLCTALSLGLAPMYAPPPSVVVLQPVVVGKPYWKKK